MNPNLRDFDNWYINHPNYYSQPSDGLIDCIQKFVISPCKTLDVGCGQGRNSVWLASKGFEVIAIDTSESAIELLREIAKQRHLKIDARQGDICKVKWGNEQFNLIVIQTTLNHIEPNCIPALCAKISELLAPKGFLYCVSFTTEDPGFKGNSEIASECSFAIQHYFSPGEMKNLFSKLEILKYDEYTKVDTQPWTRTLPRKSKTNWAKT